MAARSSIGNLIVKSSNDNAKNLSLPQPSQILEKQAEKPVISVPPTNYVKQAKSNGSSSLLVLTPEPPKPVEFTPPVNISKPGVSQVPVAPDYLKTKVEIEHSTPKNLAYSSVTEVVNTTPKAPVNGSSTGLNFGMKAVDLGTIKKVKPKTFVPQKKAIAPAVDAAKEQTQSGNSPFFPNQDVKNPVSGLSSTPEGIHAGNGNNLQASTGLSLNPVVLVLVLFGFFLLKK